MAFFLIVVNLKKVGQHAYRASNGQHLVFSPHLDCSNIVCSHLLNCWFVVVVNTNKLSFLSIAMSHFTTIDQSCLHFLHANHHHHHDALFDKIITTHYAHSKNVFAFHYEYHTYVVFVFQVVKKCLIIYLNAFYRWIHECKLQWHCEGKFWRFCNRWKANLFPNFVLICGINYTTLIKIVLGCYWMEMWFNYNDNEQCIPSKYNPLLVSMHFQFIVWKEYRFQNYIAICIGCKVFESKEGKPKKELT